MASRFSHIPYPDLSAQLGFCGNQLDRRSEKRTQEGVAEAFAHPHVKIMLIGRGRVLLAIEGQTHRPYFTAKEIAAHGALTDGAILLGYETGDVPVLAAPVTLDAEGASQDGFLNIDFRSLYIQGLVNGSVLGVLAQGAALLAWHASHKHCARCGAQSRIADSGYKRICTQCDTSHFPRTDCVVIMAVITPDDQHILLGRSPHFPQGMYSCLAGFLEPGETLENAVRRETAEEAGITVAKVSYHASQPWPFPYSMMIGCFGEAASETIKLDDELDDARWFTRSDVAAMFEGTHPDGFTMAPKGAIARTLIEYWLKG
ncbi:MAG: NAD(+) diphosphatase [Ahrensia sp.]